MAAQHHINHYEHMRSILFITALYCLACLGACNPAGAEKALQDIRPNVIILLADDLGYGDLSAYGSQSIETPHLDALAREGIKLSQFYAGSAVCTPSRACLLTGKFPLRYDIRRHFTDNEEHLPEAAVTLPEVLREAGYRTAHIGKWHLGGLRPMDFEARTAGNPANPGPLQHGFEHSLTSIEGAPIRPELIRNRQLYRQGGHYMVRNDQRAEPDDHHWTEIKVNEAIGLIDTYTENREPFFLNLWFDVPHTPYEPAPEPHLSKYQALGATGDQLYFRSMVSHLDAQIGRLVQHLKARGIFEKTIILFTSDNGPAFQGSPGPFKGGKTDLHEGGIRVPMFAIWKDHFPAGSSTFSPMHMADILPTLAAALDIPLEQAQELDGRNRLAALTDPDFAAHEALFWQMDLYKGFQNQGPKPTPYATAVIRDGHWKLLANGTGPTELFDLANDHRELYNLLDQEPEQAQALYEKLHTFLVAPRDSSGF